jgi:phospholipid-transporting ATPase
LIKSISTSNGVPTIYIPLIFIVILTGCKDLYEDLKRHRSDQEENNRLVEVWKGEEQHFK